MAAGLPSVVSDWDGYRHSIRHGEDGFRIRGVPARPRGGRVQSRGDHRIAMLGAIAGLDSHSYVDPVQDGSLTRTGQRYE